MLRFELGRGKVAERGPIGRPFLAAWSSNLQRVVGHPFFLLAAEFIRKGRFDEVFFVDLPTPAVRRDILAIHLKKRKQQRDAVDIEALVDATDGFSGAELEQAIVAALYTAFARGRALSTAILLEEIAATRPLSRTMPERITSLREWARDRTVAAD